MTATSTSDVIVRPLLRLARSRPDLLDIIVGFGDRAACRVGEEAGDDAVDEGRAAGEDELAADLQRARAVLVPAQPQRAWMFQEQPVQHRQRTSQLALQFNVLLVAPAGLEPATFGLGNHCSIRLSYGANGAA